MLPILDDRISRKEDLYFATCNCGKASSFKYKNSALNMLNRGVCSSCKPDYRSVRDADFSIYRRDDGRWCSTCAGCNCEQAYTRKDHAKQSSVSDWRCKKCRALDKSFSANLSVGYEQRVFNKFKKSAFSRGLEWIVSKEYLFSLFDGKCALTGWAIDIAYGNETASLDRIDSSKGYVVGNVQWVHSMVNMCKNKYPEQDFIDMCLAVTKNKGG
jgi:hypothetical protein